jgi:hypothetical protein
MYASSAPKISSGPLLRREHTYKGEQRVSARFCARAEEQPSSSRLVKVPENYLPKNFGDTDADHTPIDPCV